MREYAIPSLRTPPPASSAGIGDPPRHEKCPRVDCRAPLRGKMRPHTRSECSVASRLYTKTSTFCQELLPDPYQPLSALLTPISPTARQQVPPEPGDLQGRGGERSCSNMVHRIKRPRRKTRKPMPNRNPSPSGRILSHPKEHSGDDKDEPPKLPSTALPLCAHNTLHVDWRHLRRSADWRHVRRSAAFGARRRTIRNHLAAVRTFYEWHTVFRLSSCSGRTDVRSVISLALA